MKIHMAVAAACGLALLMGIPASAQTGNREGEAKGKQGDSQQQKNAGQSQQTQQKDAGHSQGRTETVRGEIAAVSVVGETMVDYSSGRGVVAEFTFLTVLGSNPDDRQSGGGDRAKSGDNSGKSGQDQASTGSQKKDDASHKDQGKQDASGGGSEGHRRRVFEFAVGPETHVRFHTSQGSQGGGDQKGQQKGSDRQQGQGSLDQLQLGDWVEVEFTRMNENAQGGQGGQGNAQKGSSNQARHGRDRIVRGMARSITILSTPGQGDHSSSGAAQSGSGSQEKKSDSSK